MKARSFGSSSRGMSTIEILLAFTILTLTLTAIIILVFGNQSLAIDTQTNVEALAKAQTELEDARALSEADFVAVEDDEVVDGAYQKKLEINNWSECQKEAISTVSWEQGGRNLDISLTTLFFDLEIALAMGGDCDPTKKGPWDNPTTAVSLGIGGQGATDIEVHDGMVYLTSSASSPGKEDLFIYEYDAVTPQLIPKSAINIGKGLLGVEVIREESTGDLYAFVLEKDNVNQLRVVKVTDPTNPSPGVSLTIPNIVFTCSPPLPPDCLAGRSLYHYDKKLYIGLRYLIDGALPGVNNELHVYDVSTPAAPVWIGSANPNHNVNDIVVGGDYAYLATSGDAQEVMVYDISTPATPSSQPVYNATGDEDANAIFLLGTQLLVGRQRVNLAAEEDFLILDAKTPSVGLSRKGGLNLGLHNNATVEGIVAREDLAFIALDDSTTGFRILNIKNPASITNHTTCSTLNYSENTTAMDMGGDEVFIANNSNNEIRVLRDQATACTP